MREIASASQFKCTIVSFVPYEIREPKPGLNPGEFVIGKSDGKLPSVLVVAEGTYGIYLDGDRGTLRARTPSTEVARSIFEDYIGAQLATDADSRPALFALPGVLSAEEVLKKYPEECQEALDAQNRWFTRLVKMGDDSWNRYHQHGAITDLMRYAAEALGLKDGREWMNVTSRVQQKENKCPACRVVVDPEAVICPSCGCVLNAEAYEKLSFAGKGNSLKNAFNKPTVNA
jgi:hypothetical protein